jgi:pimeloyl-ACP methyl ester carboxylesterase
VTPFFFGPSGRRMFGIYHPAVGPRPSVSAVLLCNPFGQEAIRVHRCYRVLSERLSRAGVSVLRFDLFGAGDSYGNDGDGDFDGWRQDVLAAHHELVRRSGSSNVRWIGARLGATLALCAAADGCVALRRLLLWDPVLNGAAYLEELRTKHFEALEMSYGMFASEWRKALKPDTDDASEAMGFTLSGRLRSQLELLSLDAIRLPRGIDIQVITDRDDEAVTRWLAAVAPHGQSVGVARVETFDWTTEEAMNSALVPNATIQRIMQSLGE